MSGVAEGRKAGYEFLLRRKSQGVSLSSHLSAAASEKQEAKSVFRFTVLLGSSAFFPCCAGSKCGDESGDCGLCALG